MKKSIIAAGVGAAVSLLAATASAESASGFSSGGYTYPAYSSPGVALLDSFYFRYEGGDHHLASLACRPENGKITLAFADVNNDDDYYYSVEHKRRTDAGIITGSFVDFGHGTALYPLTSPGAGYVFALRGFRFYYRDGSDHHMNQVAILREGSGVRTRFNDVGIDNDYVVYVDYAWLPPAVVSSAGTLSGVDDGGGVQRSLANASQAVISGFSMDFTSSDHHLQEIGVLTRTSDVQVYYSDNNQDDDFNYRVDYAILRTPVVFAPAGTSAPATASP